MLGFINLCHPDYVSDSSIALGRAAAAALRGRGIELLTVTDPVTDHRGALRAAREMLCADVDGVILFYGAFVLCSTVMAVLKEIRAPILQWAVPMMPRDGQLSTTGSYVALSMFNGTLNRLEIPHVSLIAEPDAPEALRRAGDFDAVCQTMRRLRRARFGLVGYTSMSIYPGTFDHVLLRWLIGPEIEHFDSYTLINRAEAVTDWQPALELYRSVARLPEGTPPVMLERAAKLYIALRELCWENDLEAITVKCQYEFSKEYGMVPCLPLSLLADHGIVTSCEGDIPCLVSTYMLHCLTGDTISYGDAIHHQGNCLKLSPCGYMPFSMGKPGLKQTGVSDYPGFKGMMCQFVMRPGRMTMLRLVEKQGGYALLYFTGTAVESQLRGGNMPSVDVELDGDIEKLIDRYPGQHFAICYGDLSARIEMLARLLNIELQTI